MNLIRNHFSAPFSALSAAVKSLAIAGACALVIFSTATPALAFGGGNSKPSEGLEQLDKVQKRSEQAISSGAKSASDTSNVMKNAGEGLNGVQGRAGKSKMVSPSDAEGTTVKDSIEAALEEVK